DRERPPMWRYWRALPAKGEIGIFFDTLYSEAITARTYKRISNAELDQALDRVSRFEKMLVDEGVLVLKFWLASSREEQELRFKAREAIPFKRFKITAEDWRNRDQWDQYESAVCDMVECTSTEIAPWVLVPANDKRYARIMVLKTLCHCIENEFSLIKA
ncbi:MAG: hypothetical protein RQ754_16125, partial [Desulfuromonadales bacterium]|nr:hypothetical protein [Desulfuromonadales bacterium]